ncbi:MAG TPA: DUF3127 domain-containing protein [Ignavibacteria bacterium]|nr:DUF3127 domain-containing protein [Ignavibacteria bacterium]
MNLQGKIYKIFDTNQVSDKFRKREFVIDYMSGSFPQLVKMEFSQDGCSKLDGFKIGDKVNVEFDISGREWQSPKNGDYVYFVTLRAWKIEKTGSDAIDSEPPSELMPSFNSDVTGEDLPF